MGTKTIVVNNYGIEPNSKEDAFPAIARALAQAKKLGVGKIEFSKGEYNIYPQNAWKIPYYISNTASELENKDVTKTIGVLLKEIQNLTIEGNGSLLLFHGRMTSVVIDESSNITISNLAIDHVRPTISEMTVVAIGGNYIDFQVHKDSLYEIKDGLLSWVGEGWSHRDGPAQQYDEQTNRTWRVNDPVTLAIRAEEIGPNLVRLFYTEALETSIGHVYQMRDGIRDQVGLFINKSKNIKLESVAIHYSHGLGIVGQYSTNLFFEELNFSPRSHSGRTAAAFADCIQISGCRGRVEIRDSKFVGTQDDPINVHGTHLQVVEHYNNSLVVRFMHHQTYGFNAFFPGCS